MPKIVDKDAARAALLDAAQRVIARDGLAQAKMDAIAAEAGGVAKGTLYLYFKTKQALIAALVRRHFSAAEAGLAALPAPPVTPDDFVSNLRAGMTEFGPGPPEAPPRLFFELFGSGLADPPVVRAEVKSVFDRMTALLAGQIAAVAPDDPPDPEGLAGLLVAAMDGLLLHRGLFDTPPKAWAARLEALCTLLTARLALPKPEHIR